MHHCPHCPQEFSTFAFYCPRCHGVIGELRVEGDMLAIWLLDSHGDTHKKWGVKTLKRGPEYLNLLSVSPAQPSASAGQPKITFSARSADGNEHSIERTAVDVFAEVSRPEIQEWQIQ